MSDFFATPWTVACQAPLSIGFHREEHWIGLPFPPPGDLPNPGIKPASPVSKWILGKPQWIPIIMIKLTVLSAGYLSWPIPAPQDVCGFSIFTSPRLSGPWSYMNCPPDGSGTWLVFSVVVLAFLSIAWTTATVSYLVSLLLVLLSCQPVPHTSTGCSF